MSSIAYQRVFGNNNGAASAASVSNLPSPFTINNTTKGLAPSDGVVQFTKSDGTFATILLGAAGASTGVQVAAANGGPLIQRGDGSMPSAVTFGPATSAGMQIAIAGGVFTLQRGDGSSSSGSLAASGTVSATSSLGGNTANSAQVGLILGSGATQGIRLDYTGTNQVYKLRNSNGDEGKGWILQGQHTVAKTANYTVVPADSGVHFTNNGAAGSVQFTLPTPALSLAFKFTVTAAQTVTVVTPSGSIFGPSLTGATRTVNGGTAQYTSFEVICCDGSNYVIRAVNGTVT